MYGVCAGSAGDGLYVGYNLSLDPRGLFRVGGGCPFGLRALERTNGGFEHRDRLEWNFVGSRELQGSGWLGRDVFGMSTLRNSH